MLASRDCAPFASTSEEAFVPVPAVAGKSPLSEMSSDEEGEPTLFDDSFVFSEGPVIVLGCEDIVGEIRLALCVTDEKVKLDRLRTAFFVPFNAPFNAAALA